MTDNVNLSDKGFDMKTMLCSCGSDQVNYVGIDDVEGDVVIELFKCEECGSYLEQRTMVYHDGPDDDDDELLRHISSDVL